MRDAHELRSAFSQLGWDVDDFIQRMVNKLLTRQL